MQKVKKKVLLGKNKRIKENSEHIVNESDSFLSFSKPMCVSIQITNLSNYIQIDACVELTSGVRPPLPPLQG